MRGRRDVNALLTRATQEGLDDLLVGFDPKLRDADAHGAFAVEAEGVRLTGMRGSLEYLTDEELVDVTLAGTESVVALYWGVVAALVAAGVDTDELDEAVSAEVTGEDKIKFVLLLNGWHDVEVTFRGEGVIANGSRDGPNAVGLISAVVSVVPDDCATITLIAQRTRRTRTPPAVPSRRSAAGVAATTPKRRRSPSRSR